MEREQRAKVQQCLARMMHCQLASAFQAWQAWLANRVCITSTCLLPVRNVKGLPDDITFRLVQ